MYSAGTTEITSEIWCYFLLCVIIVQCVKNYHTWWFFFIMCYNEVMDYGILISAILGSAGLFSLLQYLITRHDKKNDDLFVIKRDIKELKSTQDQVILRVTRMELLNLIDKQPNNIDAILQVAEYYFIGLNGNAYAHSLFEEWAKQHNVAIGWLPKLKKGNK